MESIAPSTLQAHDYPPGFRARRVRNWFFLGLLYAAYYLCRYNLSTVTPEMAKELGYNNQQTGQMSTARDLGYAVGTFVNGLFADALGGKQSMAIGALATIVLNLAFGWYSTWGLDAAVLLVGFVVIRLFDGYGQAFGSPGMVKINTAWFRRTERGQFSGIFGAMIQLGAISVNQLSKYLLGGFSFALFGVAFFTIGKLDWRTMFVVPPIILAVILVVSWLTVRNTPEDAGYSIPVDPGARDIETPAPQPPLSVVFATIASNPLVWVNAAAYFCTGFVRRATDFWAFKYLDNVWHVGKQDPAFGWMGFLLPASAVVGSFAAGWLSDKVFRSRRSPVAALLYGLETVVIAASVWILGYSPYASVTVACTALVLISLTCNTSHSIIGSAAVMDIGGRHMAGFALGVINSFQYFGAILAGSVLGRLIDEDKEKWIPLFAAMLPFSLLATVLMAVLAWRTRGREVRGA